MGSTTSYIQAGTSQRATHRRANAGWSSPSTQLRSQAIVSSDHGPALTNEKLYAIASSLSKLDELLLLYCQHCYEKIAQGEINQGDVAAQRLVQDELADLQTMTAQFRDIRSGRFVFSSLYLKERRILHYWGTAFSFLAQILPIDDEVHQPTLGYLQRVTELAASVETALLNAAPEGVLVSDYRLVLFERWDLLERPVGLYHQHSKVPRTLATWPELSHRIQEAMENHVPQKNNTALQAQSRKLNVIWLTFIITFVGTSIYTSALLYFAKNLPRSANIRVFLQCWIAQLLATLILRILLKRLRNRKLVLPMVLAMICIVLEPLLYLTAPTEWANFVVLIATGTEAYGFLQLFSQLLSFQQTAVLLPSEFEDLKVSTHSTSNSIGKWNFVWRKCLPGSATPSPSVKEVISRSETQLILQELLGSSAASPLSSKETKQSAVEKALSAIYLDRIDLQPQPFTEFESPISDSRDISSADPNILHYQDSIINGLRPSIFNGAVLDVDHDKVHDILKNSFDQVATDEYEWLLELKALGLSMDEIADELLERSQHGPWIYSKINVLDIGTYHHGFHIPRCLHSRKEDETMPTVSSQPSHGLTSIEGDSENQVRETIGYLCGIGGVSPMPDGSHNLQFGSVVFENGNSTAIASLLDNKSVQVVPHVLQNLEKAIGTLQQVGGCCDSFTFLARRESLVELERIEPSSTSGLEPLISRTNSETSFRDINPQLLPSLTAQFFSLAFAIYSQGHCEPFRPFFLDTPLKRILLIGNQIWRPSFSGPCILASPVELSCFGEMVQRQVFAFQYFEGFERSKVFSDLDIQLDLKACPEDLLDTWGPGDFIVPNDDSERIHAISIGGGLITSQSTENQQLSALHWSRASECTTEISSTFSRNEKKIIGSRVLINQACKVTHQEQIQMAIPWLRELGTFPSHWEVSERQLGFGVQAGQSAVGILNFAQTWVKRLGQTKKSCILAKRPLSIADLEGPFAVQVSFCTGVARRVRLRELLADVLPAYVSDLATAPVHWKRLQGCNILQMLRDGDFKAHYQRLDRELQAEFETLAIAVLVLLQDTGVDRRGENFVVACIPPGIAVQCLKIPTENESFWARILADSEDVATFAYVATRCFETDLVRCRGPKEPWMNTTALFSTAVSLCQDSLAKEVGTVQHTNWSLKDSEAYLIGRVDAPLLVRVLRPSIQEEPRLLVSMSTIIAPFLRRWSRKQGYKRPWRLRESRAIDHQHQMAESVVVAAAFEA